MGTIVKVVKAMALVLISIFLGQALYALPATLSLAPGLRPGIETLTLHEAACRLRATGQKGMALVEAARALVAERMQYCRRNSFDSPARAFERGYGFCTQQAYALAELLTRLGFEAQVVHAFRNRFPDGSGGGHAWVRVWVEGETRSVDSIHYDPEAGQLTFTPLSRVLNHTALFGLLTKWGEAAVNAHRYYLSGKDE